MKIRRGIVALLACVATSAMILVATPLPASDEFVPKLNAPYPLINVGSRKCFAPASQDGHDDVNGLLIQQRTCDPKFRQEFVSLGLKETNDTGGFLCEVFGCIRLKNHAYYIKTWPHELCLDVQNGATSDSSVVQQSECTDARSMAWYIEPGDFPGNTFKVRNLNSDLCLDVRGGSSDENAQLQQYHCTSQNAAQNFLQTFPPHEWLNASGDPLVRFKGNLHDFSQDVEPQDVGVTVLLLNLVIFTGNDDLRGGSHAGDNCDVTVVLASGPPITLTNVNGSHKWANWTYNTVNIPLPNGGLRGGDVKTVKLHTGFGGGIGGDNWNVQRIHLQATLP